MIKTMRLIATEVRILLGLEERFTPPKGFKVPKGFPRMRMKSILIKKENENELTKTSGLYLPSNLASINKFVGRIYAVGPNKEARDLKPGMRVIFNALADQTILFDNQEYRFMSSIDVFAVLPENVDTYTNSIKREGRKQYSAEEMPKAEMTPEAKEAMEAMQEEINKRNELLFRDDGAGAEDLTQK